MSSELKEPPLRTVFLSYASEDRAAAQVLRDALPGFGLEVWYDESALHGGDAWDQKIRNQIRDCDFFIPIISAQTEARHEGYFRREWRMAVDRSHDMADDHTFLLPVVIDDTSQTGARVPEKFFTVQWSRLPGGQPNASFEAVCRSLASGKPLDKPKRSERAERARPTVQADLPPFPKQDDGQKLRFFLAVTWWALRCLWIQFKRLPRWIRIVVYLWIVVVLLSKGCSSSQSHSHKLSDQDAQKLDQISKEYRGSKEDVAKLGTQIAKTFADEVNSSKKGTPLLAVPFTAPSGDTAAQQFADATFAQVYGRLSISHHGHAALSDSPLPSMDSSAVLERARAQQAEYVVYGFVDGAAPNQILEVKLVEVEDGTLSFTKSYALTGADPAKIAEDLDAKIRDAE
jgi:TolB-like protein